MKTSTISKRLVMGIVVGLIVMGGLGFVATRMGPWAPTKITVAEVKVERLMPSVYGIGTVEARQSWLMGPTGAGRVSQVHVDVGQSVKAGQLLAEMDLVDLNQRLQAQDAAVSKAASLEAAANAQVSEASARRELAATNLNRQRDLANQKFISPSALEGREQELQSADAALKTAAANVQATQQESERLKAERAALLRQKQNTQLRAPADAVVISRDAEPGSTVVAGQPVLRLANPASFRVKLRVDQARSSGLETGLPAQIVLRSRAQEVLAGKVERIELQADPVTEERIAQVSFERMPTSLSIGEMAEVTLNLQPSEAAPTVPLASAQMHLGQSGAWRLKDGALRFVPVKWGASSLDGRVQALTGLAQGDTVVVFSEKPLSDGQRFKVVDALTPKAKP